MTEGLNVVRKIRRVYLRERAARLARRAPVSREEKAALTLGLAGG